MTLPNSTVAGTNTRGALGLLVNNDILTMEDRLKWGTSGREHNFTSISDLELRNYERIGLTPDVHIEHEGNIIDKQLEISN